MQLFPRTALILALLLARDVALGAETALVPANEAVAQKSQVEWSVLWWKWAASFEREDSPVADRVGDVAERRTHALNRGQPRHEHRRLPHDGVDEELRVHGRSESGSRAMSSNTSLFRVKEDILCLPLL